MPTEKSPFVRGTISATASLQVHVRPGTRLSPAQVAGIKQFVAHSVANLSIENVTVIDQNANLLSEAWDDPDELRSSEEQKLTAKIREIIEPVVGADKVKVTARIEYDRRTIQTTDESFHDPTVRSTDTTTTGAVVEDLPVKEVLTVTPHGISACRRPRIVYHVYATPPRPLPP